MQKQNGLTRRDVIIIVTVIFFMILILLPAHGKHPPTVWRVYCAMNLKGLGAALAVYANDHDGMYPQLPGKGPWDKELGFGYYLEKPDFSEGGSEEYSPRTISASLYLLVRECDVSPKSFVCEASGRQFGIKPFEGDDLEGRDIVELWDFGSDPYKHVSYSFHNPYGNFPAHGNLSSSFAIAADMNPWFKDGDILPPGEDKDTPQIIDFNERESFYLGNSANHPNYEKKSFFSYEAIPDTNRGQNVLYAGGYVGYEQSADVGVRHDNIYTFWPTTENPTEQDIRNGENPTSRSKENDAKSKDDSFLAI